MPWVSRNARRLALTAAVLGGAEAPLLRGQAPDDDLVEVQSEQPNRVIFGAGGRFAISEQNIDVWVYGNESRGRDWLSASLKQKVDDMGRVCGLSEMQKQKLVLAGEGDIQRFDRRVEELKAKCQNGTVRREDWNEIVQKTQPLRAALQRGLFGRDSLFQKAVATALRPEQATRYEQVGRQRHLYHYCARVELCVAQLDSVVGLRDAQRQQLLQLILEKTRPPKSFGPSDRFVVLALMSRIPEEKLKPIFDPDQWLEVKRRLLQAKRMMPALKQSGVILDDEDAPANDAELLEVHPAVQVEMLNNGHVIFMRPAR
jgi:hypothetical protein